MSGNMQTGIQFQHADNKSRSVGGQPGTWKDNTFTLDTPREVKNMQPRGIFGRINLNDAIYQTGMLAQKGDGSVKESTVAIKKRKTRTSLLGQSPTLGSKSTLG